MPTVEPPRFPSDGGASDDARCGLVANAPAAPPVPFNWPWCAGTEESYIGQVFANGRTSGDGPFTARCSSCLERALGVRRALLTTSCTHALEMTMMLLDVRAGDEVIVPSFTFVSVANAVALRGARPVFADVRADTLNIDERRIEQLITPRTKAIVVVHYAGVGCEMDEISAVAARHGVAVVEDAAHGLFGRYRGRALGTFGALATLSFHETKNIACGEGGALLVNDPAYVERAEVLREKGTNRRKYFSGLVDKYTWVDIGSSYLMSDLLAACLHAQLECRDTIQANRRRVWERYEECLRPWAREHDVGLPTVPPHCEQSYHMFYLLLPDARHRPPLIDHLKTCGVDAVFHYQPLHLSEMGRRYGGASGHCPVTEDVSDRLLRLPFFTGLTEAQQQRVIDGLMDFAWPAF